MPACLGVCGSQNVKCNHNFVSADELCNEASINAVVNILDDSQSGN